ncbi:MAG: helix-turn-helix domain-containing protein [Clostridiales bacterium]|nr:helix-turn-helix domain-containing protein [Clostridiales bacterium]MDO5140307.1 helix-turn-helix domain-containing protein [Eubacteriales bacterium]
MISNQVVQNTLNDISGITDTKAAVFDRSGKLIASVDYVSTAVETQVYSFIKSDKHEAENDSCCFVRAEYDGELVFVIAAEKGNDKAELTAKLLASGLISLLRLQREKGDKDDFIKNLLLDNLLQIDIFNRARKLGVDFKAPRAVFVIESDGRDSIYDMIRGLSFFGENDFMTGIDEGSQTIVHEIKDVANAKEELRRAAEEMLSEFSAQGIFAYIAYGSVVNELKGVSLSYKEARLAHDVRRIFYEDERIISYGELGIGRLIYQLPINLCRMFINETFGGKTFEEFDEETLMTINKFFENNLNVSETSRQLFIHRNTLVYRLDKLQKTAGLDLRVFDDAITFKIALMVVKYIDYMDRLDY